MNTLDSEFFEQYKRLDRLCTDLLSCSQNGVSEYIKEMEKISYGQMRVVSWSTDYQQLKLCRHLRNQLAHENTADLCEEENLDFIQSFYTRIMNQTDPLAQYRKVQKDREERERAYKRQIKQQKKEEEEIRKERAEYAEYSVSTVQTVHAQNGNQSGESPLPENKNSFFHIVKKIFRILLLLAIPVLLYLIIRTLC